MNENVGRTVERSAS